MLRGSLAGHRPFLRRPRARGDAPQQPRNLPNQCPCDGSGRLRRAAGRMVVMSDAIMRLRRSLADKVGSIGWRKALEAVPRELFLGAAVYRADPDRGDLWTPARRAEVGMEEWLSLAYSDQTWVTQVEGMLAEDAAGIVAGSPSSSSTFPSLVVLMLEAAQIGEDDKVLEIGTGTGYSTALLAERLGSGTVTSVE